MSNAEQMEQLMELSKEMIHVKCGANGAAHGIAKLATRERIDKI